MDAFQSRVNILLKPVNRSATPGFAYIAQKSVQTRVSQMLYALWLILMEIQRVCLGARRPRQINWMKRLINRQIGLLNGVQGAHEGPGHIVFEILRSPRCTSPANRNNITGHEYALTACRSGMEEGSPVYRSRLRNPSTLIEKLCRPKIERRGR